MFVDRHIKSARAMYAQSQEELLKLALGGNSGVDETKEVMMSDETGHMKRCHSDLSISMMENVYYLLRKRDRIMELLVIKSK